MGKWRIRSITNSFTGHRLWWALDPDSGRPVDCVTETWQEAVDHMNNVEFMRLGLGFPIRFMAGMP